MVREVVPQKWLVLLPSSSAATTRWYGRWNQHDQGVALRMLLAQVHPELVPGQGYPLDLENCGVGLGVVGAQQDGLGEEAGWMRSMHWEMVRRGPAAEA